MNVIDRPCLACVVGVFEECHNPREVEGAEGFIIPCAVWLNEIDSPVRVEKERNPVGRPLIDPADSKDPLSAGRKRAAALHPILEGMRCEWAGLRHAGGGLFPLVGCDGHLLKAKGKHEGNLWQGDLHHGPDKNVFHNTPGVNLHAICNQCVVGETRLLTEDLRWVRADELQEGEHLIGFDESLKTRKYEPSVVESVSRVTEPCYEILLSNGDRLTVSHNHEWVASRPSDRHLKWYRTEQFLNVYETSRLGTFTMRKVVDVWEPDTSYEAGWLAGFLDGEGHLGTTHLTAYQTIEGDNLVPAEEMLRQFESRAPGRVNHQWRKSTDSRKEGLAVRLTRKSDILRVLGQVRPSRLLAKVGKFLYGKTFVSRDTLVEVKSVTYVGEREVYSIQTSSRTYIADGYLSHNCHKRWHELNDPYYAKPRPTPGITWTPEGEYYGHDPITGSTEADRIVNEEWWSLPVDERTAYPFEPPTTSRKFLTTPSDLGSLSHNPFTGEQFGIL